MCSCVWRRWAPSGIWNLHRKDSASICLEQQSSSVQPPPPPPNTYLHPNPPTPPNPPSSPPPLLLLSISELWDWTLLLWNPSEEKSKHLKINTQWSDRTSLVGIVHCPTTTENDRGIYSLEQFWKSSWKKHAWRCAGVFFQAVGPWYAKERWPDDLVLTEGIWNRRSIRGEAELSWRNVNLEDVTRVLRTCAIRRDFEKTSERQGGVHMGFPERIYTILNWSELNRAIKFITRNIQGRGGVFKVMVFK